MSLKVLHTSDWHIGKKLYNQCRLSEQKELMDWTLTYLKKNKIDIFLISGDIFDGPRPSHDAIKIFYNFLSELQLTQVKKIILIGGNHDSGYFLETVLPLLDPEKILIVGQLKEDYKKHIHQFEDFGLVTMPFFRAHEISKWKSEFGNLDLSELVNTFMDKASEQLDSKKPKLFMGHHLFGEYEAAGSEHFISLSGVESISTKHLKENFDYSALGHIHKYQKISKKSEIYYSGSPLPFHFNESDSKSFNFISFENSVCQVEKLILPKWINLQRLKIKYSDLEKNLESLKTSTLPVLLDLTVELTEPTTGIAEYITKFINNTNITLVSLQQLLKKEGSENKISKNYYQDIEDIFIEFAKDKYELELDKSSPIYKEFISLVEEINLETP